MNLADETAPDYPFRKRSALSRDELLEIISDLEPDHQRLFRVLRLRSTTDGDLYRRSTGRLYLLIREHPASKGQVGPDVSRIYMDVVSILGGLL
jgi:hypothetical protein